MSATAYMVTVGSYSDYQVLAVSLTRDEAQRYADAYNAERESTYRDEAEVEEVDLFGEGDPLPRRITLWNGEERGAWPITYVTTRPEKYVPTVSHHGRTFARHFPSEEAARSAIQEATRGEP